MNLHEKILSTAPGKHADMLRDLLYYRGESLGADWAKKIRAAAVYLDVQAAEAIEGELGEEFPWLTEWIKKKTGAPTAQTLERGNPHEERVEGREGT